MKRILFIIPVVFLMISSHAMLHAVRVAPESDNPGEATFTVLGNCGMCKDRIERAAYTVRGVRSASWDQDAQKLTVKFRPDRASQEQIERAVAKAGHDTENFLTHDEIHANLHHCCIYKRDPKLLKKNKKFDEE